MIAVVGRMPVRISFHRAPHGFSAGCTDRIGVRNNGTHALHSPSMVKLCTGACVSVAVRSWAVCLAPSRILPHPDAPIPLHHGSRVLSSCRPAGCRIGYTATRLHFTAHWSSGLL